MGNARTITPSSLFPLLFFVSLSFWSELAASTGVPSSGRGDREGGMGAARIAFVPFGSRSSPSEELPVPGAMEIPSLVKPFSSSANKWDGDATACGVPAMETLQIPIPVRGTAVSTLKASTRLDVHPIFQHALVPISSG